MAIPIYTVKGKSEDFFGKITKKSINTFFMKKLKLKNNFEYSFDAEKAHLSIGEVFRAIRGRYRNENSFPKKKATLWTELYQTAHQFIREILKWVTTVVGHLFRI